MLGIFNEDIEEQATGIEADVVKAIMESVPLAVNSKLALRNILDKLNQGRQEDEQTSPRNLGWVLKRLGFRKTRLGNKDATRAIEVDLSLLDHLAKTYDVSPGTTETLEQAQPSAISANSAIKVRVHPTQTPPNDPKAASTPQTTAETTEMAETTEHSTSSIQGETTQSKEVHAGSVNDG